MVTKKNCFSLLLLLLTLIPVQADEFDYYMEQRFIQRLTWSGDEYALRYEVIIDRETEGGYERAHQEFTNAFSLNVSLSPGRYRYQVIPYDFFDQPGRSSEWVVFDVYPALPPELNYVLTDLEYLEKNNQLVLFLSGRNLDPNSHIRLGGRDGTVYTPVDKHIFNNGTNARLFFNNPYSMPDNFTIMVTNPGGFETSMEAVIYIPPPPPPPYKHTDYYLGAAFMPLFSLYGEMNWLSEINPVLPGAAARFGLVYTGRDGAFGLGIEAAASWFTYFSVQSLIIDANLLAQKRAPNEKTALFFRIGAGYNILLGDSDTHDFSEWERLHINIGSSFLWFMWKHLYLETGLDFLYWLKEDINSSCFRPWAGIGWRF